MQAWRLRGGSVSRRFLNIAPVGDLELPDPEPPPPLPEPECTPFLVSRVVFLPLSTGEALRRMVFLPIPLQMLR